MLLAWCYKGKRSIDHKLMPQSIVEPQVIVRDFLQLMTHVAVLNGDPSWRPYWDKMFPDTGPPRWTRQSPFRRFFAFGVRQPARFVRHDFCKQLLEFVDAWSASGESFRVFWQSYPSLADKLRIACRNSRMEIVFGPDGDPVLAPMGVPQGSERGIFLACREFLDFVQNPLGARLGKCVECSKYYIAIRSSPNKSFCSTVCHRSGSPKLSMRRKRAEIWRKRMERVEKALQFLASRQEPQPDWKEWISKQAGVNKGWLTRAVNEGKLKPPQLQVLG